MLPYDCYNSYVITQIARYHSSIVTHYSSSFLMLVIVRLFNLTDPVAVSFCSDPICTEVSSKTDCDVILTTVLFSVNFNAKYSELHSHIPFLQHKKDEVPLSLTFIILP